MDRAFSFDADALIVHKGDHFFLNHTLFDELPGADQVDPDGHGHDVGVAGELLTILLYTGYRKMRGRELLRQVWHNRNCPR